MQLLAALPRPLVGLSRLELKAFHHTLGAGAGVHGAAWAPALLQEHLLGLQHLLHASLPDVEALRFRRVDQLSAAQLHAFVACRACSTWRSCSATSQTRA